MRPQIRFCALAVDADPATITVAATVDDRGAAAVTVTPMDADRAIRAYAEAIWQAPLSQ